MRPIIRLFSTVMVFLSLALAIPSFAASSPEPEIARGNHEALAKYYADQVQDFKAKARFWDNTAEAYERFPELFKASDVADHAAHCRQIARNYRKMADEAAHLVSEHLSLVRHGQGP